MRIIENTYFLNYSEEFKNILNEFFKAFNIRVIGTEKIEKNTDVAKLIAGIKTLRYNEQLYYFTYIMDNVYVLSEHLPTNKICEMALVSFPVEFRLFPLNIEEEKEGKWIFTDDSKDFINIISKKYNIKFYVDEFDIKKQRYDKLTQILDKNKIYIKKK